MPCYIFISIAKYIENFVFLDPYILKVQPILGEMAKGFD